MTPAVARDPEAIRWSASPEAVDAGTFLGEQLA
jgi:hypothetical protein